MEREEKHFFFLSFFQGWLCFSTSSPCPWTAHPEKEHNHCRHKTSAAAVSICRQTSLPTPTPPSPSTALQARLNSYPLSWQLAWRLPVWYVNLSEPRLMLQLTTIKKKTNPHVTVDSDGHYGDASFMLSTFKQYILFYNDIFWSNGSCGLSFNAIGRSTIGTESQSIESQYETWNFAFCLSTWVVP